MAKMFYSTEEVQQKLGISAEQVKQFVAEGKLREFSSGAKVMFKVDDVDQLAASAASGSAAGEIPLGSADSGEQIGFSPGDSADHIGLSPGESGADMGSAASGSGSVIGLAPGDSADRISLDDTSQGQDDKDDTVVTSDGVNVLDDSDGLAEAIDPLAQTQMAPDLDDHVDLDSGSSGSGLLDLSREADDTSLGAELLEEIYPGSDQEQVETQIPTQLEVPSSVSSAMSIESPESMPEFVRAVEMVDPISGSFGAMLLVPLIVLIYLGSVTAAGMVGVRPGLLETISRGYTVWIVMVSAFVASVIILGIGKFATSRSAAPATPKTKTRKPKAKKERKPKKAKGS